MTDADAIHVFGSLAHTVRYRVFRLLVAVSPSRLAAGDIADQLGLRPSTLSSHLSQLERAGIITAERDGVRLLYGLEPARVRGLIAHLVDDCCDGRPDLCGLSARSIQEADTN